MSSSKIFSFLIIFVALFSSMHGTFIPNSPACEIAQDPESLLCYKFGAVEGILQFILDLLNEKVTITCDTATNILTALGCVEDGHLVRENVREVLEPLYRVFAVMTPASHLGNQANPTYQMLTSECLGDEYLDGPCPCLDFLDCFLRTINYNCEVSYPSTYCNTVSQSAVLCNGFITNNGEDLVVQ